MKVVQINTSCGVGSTGKICIGISQLLTKNEVENYVLYSSMGNGYPLGIRCSDDKIIKIQALKSKILGNYGFNSKKITQRMIVELDRIQPDVVHLHNIHGHDCNLEGMFSYFRENKTKLFWTFHDCWAFTAYCPYFTMVKCDKWKMHCNRCVRLHEYSWFCDRSFELFEKKKELLKGLDLTIVTPSQWLADLTKLSFMRDYPVQVINNGIDLSIFHPMESEFRKIHHLERKHIVLGVSFDWDERKGLDVFVELADRFPAEYQIVLVGTNERIDKKLPDNILAIHRTNDQRELVEIYSVADVFVNPTREENYPTVNMESIACGTPVLTFRTGGSPEMLDETCGAVVDCDDIDALDKEIIRICENKPYTKEACLKKAKEFDKNERFKEYIDLYERINTAGTEKH